MIIKLTAERICKSFDRIKVLDNISFDIQIGEGLIIAGPNGSGKSTLIKILCNLLRPNSGEILYSVDNQLIDISGLRYCIGFVAPDFKLYNELTAKENITFFSKLKGVGLNISYDDLLSEYDLKNRGDDLVGVFSYGMKQRLKYIIALLGDPLFLFLDEPTANLDENGKEMVDLICKQHKKKGVLIVATNEERDLKYGDKVLRLDQNSISDRS